MRKIFLIFFCAVFSSVVFGNNIRLQKLSLTDTNRLAKTVNIKMNISWEHSWRDSVNWDAAWIFVKYKEPKDKIWKWKHAKLSQSGNDIGTGIAVMKIVVPDDLMGAFFYRSLIGAGNVTSENVKFTWNYGTAGVTNIDSVEVRVFATEMVYVPAGSFCIGDAYGKVGNYNAFGLKQSPDDYAVINKKWSPLIIATNSFVSGEDKTMLKNGLSISGLQGVDIDSNQVADYPDFPTGYRSYYCMKYKVTQGQYADFLNSLYANDTTTTALNSFLSVNDPYYLSKLKSIPKELKAVWLKLADNFYSFPIDLQRNTIVFDTAQVKFTVSRPDRLYGKMTMLKSLSFSEWAGLRSMSELEYEKACRGPLPPAKGEYAWGYDKNFPVSGASKLTFSGIENGTEYFSDYHITERYFSDGSIIGGDGGTGPYRAGIFASDTSSRILSQTGYYGAMDLGRITSDLVVPVGNTQSRLLSYLKHGKGSLSAFGENYSIANAAGINSSTITRYGPVSARAGHNAFNGFRAARTSPSDN